MAMPAEPRGGRCPIASLLPALIASTALAILVAQAVALLRGWDPGVGETPPTFRSPGPTVVQLERLQQLVSTRVHVADVLVGESRWLEGSWIIQGDALLAVDLSKAEVKDGDEKARTAAIVLPRPAVLSARVNHERTRQWDIKSRSWIPLAGAILGDRRAIEEQAMRRGPAARREGRRHGRQQGGGAAGRGGHALRVLPRGRLAGVRPLEVTSRAGTSPMPACRGATIAVASIAVIPDLDERAAIPRGTAAPLHSSGGKMSTLIDRIETRSANGRSATDDTTPAQRLRSTMAAARVSFTWFGTQKTLTPEQKAQAAEAFDAEGQFLSAGKKLIDTRHSAFRAVTAIRGKVDSYWKGHEPAVPRARRPADQARRRSSRSPPR